MGVFAVGLKPAVDLENLLPGERRATQRPDIEYCTAFGADPHIRHHRMSDCPNVRYQDCHGGAMPVRKQTERKDASDVSKTLHFLRPDQE